MLTESVDLNIITDATKALPLGRRMTADRELDGISGCSAYYAVSNFSCGSNVLCREEQP